MPHAGAVREWFQYLEANGVFGELNTFLQSILCFLSALVQADLVLSWVEKRSQAPMELRTSQEPIGMRTMPVG